MFQVLNYFLEKYFLSTMEDKIVSTASANPEVHRQIAGTQFLSTAHELASKNLEMQISSILKSLTDAQP
jgi:hypothetical protein